MKTICIKTNNQNAIDYLLKTLERFHLNDVVYSCHKFKTFNNIFIHYKGSSINMFLYNISEILSTLVLEVYENDLATRILSCDYFYFNNTERHEILLNFKKLCYEDIDSFLYKKKKLINVFNNLINQNNKIFLKGVITFRINDYIKKLQNQIDSSVNQYLIEKEYNEFVSLLKIYINTEPCKIDLLHIIYNNGSPILLDKNKNIIKTDSNILNAKYLSDITFSDCDIALNTLLNLIPQKIYLHLVDEKSDEFINTLKLIFENRIIICDKFSFGDGPFL